MPTHDEPASTERQTLSLELGRGGVWLAKAREWMQSNVWQGDFLSWGSDAQIWIEFRKLEDFARHVAMHAILEDREKRKGPGTPTARFGALMDELEQRFPHPNPTDSTKAPERYVLEAIDKLINDDAAKQRAYVNVPRGWTAWYGQGVHPDGDTKVQYRMRDGDMGFEHARAGDLDWAHTPLKEDWEIVGYKVVA